jgi:transposase
MRNGRADSARRARLILLLAEGLTWVEIRAKLDCGDSYISRWSKRFEVDRLGGLFARHSGRERYKVADRVEARVLAWTTKHKPADGSTHWSSRKLAAIVARYGGDHRVREFSCAHQFRCMAFAQLTYRESLRDLATCLQAQSAKLYRLGLSTHPVLRRAGIS